VELESRTATVAVNGNGREERPIDSLLDSFLEQQQRDSSSLEGKKEHLEIQMSSNIHSDSVFEYHKPRHEFTMAADIQNQRRELNERFSLQVEDFLIQ
jgi:hypothetical protein